MWWKQQNLISHLRKIYGDSTTQQYLRAKFADPANKMAFAVICFPHHLKLKSPPFHEELFRLYSLPKNIAVAAPRGHAKSTTLAIDDAFDIVNGYRHYIVRISDSYTQALEHVQALQYELEYNEILHWLYGDLTTEDWAMGEFVTAKRTKVVAKGQGMKVRGMKYNQWRPDKIGVDDLENDELVASSDRRRKLKNWFKLGVLPALAKDGKINYIGTILHGDALLAQIVNKQDEFSGWETRKYQAITDDKALWPEMWSLNELLRIKNDPTHPRYMGHIAFQQEYQNEPISEEDAIIKRQWIKFKDRDYPEWQKKIIVVDPAISKADTADFTSIKCWGLGIDGSCYELEAIRERLSYRQQGYEIRAMYHRQSADGHAPDEVLIEEVAYQQALKEHDQLKGLPVIGLKVDKDKRRRLIVVSKWYEAGEVYHKSTSENTVEELVNFGSTPHDDEADTTSMGINRLKNSDDIGSGDIFFA